MEMTYWRIYYAGCLSDYDRHNLTEIFYDFKLKFLDKPMPVVIVTGATQMDAQEIADRIDYEGADVVCLQRDVGVPP